MAGSAINTELKDKGHCDEANGGALLTPTWQELDLLDAEEVGRWYKENKPDMLVMAAAKVGGILRTTLILTTFS